MTNKQKADKRREISLKYYYSHREARLKKMKEYRERQKRNRVEKKMKRVKKPTPETGKKRSSKVFNPAYNPFLANEEMKK